MLSDDHRRELEQHSAIHSDVVAERGYETITAQRSAELTALGIQVRSRDAFPGLLLPMFRATGERISTQFKPATPLTLKRRTIKYLSPLGQPNHVDIHPRNRERIRDTSVPLWITEGIKKGDSLTARECCVATLTGVFNWRSKMGTLGDWEDIPLKGRDVILCFDADAKKNINVARAMVRLGRWCRSKGANPPRYLIVPAEVNNTATKGVDDYFAAGGTVDTLTEAATTEEPETETFTDAFSDSRLAEVIAEEVLDDHFVWCKTLGWLNWTGKRWSAVTENRAGETIRRYAVRRFTEAAQVGDQTALKGWRSMLKASRQTAVLNLAKGIVERDADDFDSHPDLLNTPGGVVNLRTGSLQPHDPDLFLTKMTRGSYRTESSHSDWDQALSAVPEDATSWLQARIGQAITGHTTSDGLIVIAQGSGENGKTTVLSAVMQALGDYAAPCSSKLIASKDEHSTERADLRGQRLLVAEELTENRALNVTAIKQVTDVVQIKARYVHKDNQTFPASHSLFITTNYIPVVNETDHGTWRRLALLVFAFVYRKPGQALAGPRDRYGDPGIKARLKAGRDGQHDAIITWAVEGAVRWYTSGFPLLPPSVDADTRSWRKEADRILGFWDEQLVPDTNACIVTTELMQAFNAWMKSNGHSDWSKELFGSRFKAHEETKCHHVEEHRPRNLQNLFVSRPPNVEERVKERPHVYVGVRFRAAYETSEDTNDAQREWSERSDVPDIVEQIADQLTVLGSSDRSDQTCCQGGVLVPRCKLCRQSPTYWQGSIEAKADA